MNRGLIEPTQISHKYTLEQALVLLLLFAFSIQGRSRVADALDAS